MSPNRWLPGNDGARHRKFVVTFATMGMIFSCNGIVLSFLNIRQLCLNGFIRNYVTDGLIVTFELFRYFRSIADVNS